MTKDYLPGFCTRGQCSPRLSYWNARDVSRKQYHNESADLSAGCRRWRQLLYFRGAVSMQYTPPPTPSVHCHINIRYFVEWIHSGLQLSSKRNTLAVLNTTTQNKRAVNSVDWITALTIMQCCLSFAVCAVDILVNEADGIAYLQESCCWPVAPNTMLTFKICNYK
jgi:hypothetical protein